tara:strand:+ start:139 stop:366 length:228 start_codon:yes stop_codon:yes gene_type:complete
MGLQMPLSLYYVGVMKIFIPDPYTTSLAVAMYYQVPVRRNDKVLEAVFEKELKEKNPRTKVQPSENIGRNIDTYA